MGPLQKPVGSYANLAVHNKQEGKNLLHENVNFASPETDYKFRSAHNPSVRRIRQKHSLTRPYVHNFYNIVQ